MEKARSAYARGEYRWVAEVVNHVVFADPSNQEARGLQADALEQMGYQSESGPWRNFYLTGAKELRDGVVKLPAPSTASPDSVRAMSLDLFFNYLGVRLNGPKADDTTLTLNFAFTDTEGTSGTGDRQRGAESPARAHHRGGGCDGHAHARRARPRDRGRKNTR
jgi:alkyl sulfatase BDS1-like metallo-beta-lactamase superfamily hydrolase